MDDVVLATVEDTNSKLHSQSHFCTIVHRLHSNQPDYQANSYISEHYSPHRQQNVPATIFIRIRNLEALAARWLPNQLERGPPLLVPYRSGQVRHRLWCLQHFFLAGWPGLILVVLARLWLQQASVEQASRVHFHFNKREIITQRHGPRHDSRHY